MLEADVMALQQRTNIDFEYCKLQSDGICGPCLWRYDERLLKKYYCGCQNFQVKQDC